MNTLYALARVYLNSKRSDSAAHTAKIRVDCPKAQARNLYRNCNTLMVSGKFYLENATFSPHKHKSNIEKTRDFNGLLVLS